MTQGQEQPPSPAPLIDSHAHLDFPQFEGQLDAVIERARAAGIERIVSIGTTYEGALRTLDIAASYPNVSPAAGVHPSYIVEGFARFEELAKLFETAPFVAVGETGLDFYRMHTPAAVQENAFRAHIELALARDLPVIIHVRDAYEDALRVLDSTPKMPRGVFHCFSGTAEFAREGLARGFYISFAGQVTFKNADALRTVAATVPMERILVETDCPYLAPVPHRGKDNEPAFVRHTAEMIAKLKGVGIGIAAAQTAANAKALFRLA
jgi:TatD DNase family protein